MPRPKGCWYCLTPLGQRIVEDNFKLVGWCLGCWAWTFRGLGRDDMESELTETLVDCAARFNPNLGFKFSSYFRESAWRRLTRACRVKLTRARVVAPATGGEVGPVHFATAPERPVDLAEDVEAMKDAMRSLKPRYRTALVESVGNDRRLADIALDLGVSKERVRQMRNKAINELQRRMKVEV